MRVRVRWFLAAFSILAVGTGLLKASDWPQSCVVHEGSESPDAHYGIVVPESNDVEKQRADAGAEEYYYVNYLADLKNHKLLGKIRDSDYFEHQNHADLQTVWADDSSWCVVEYDGRFGFGSISILEPKGLRFVQTDIGKMIDKTLASEIRKKSHDADAGGGDGTVYYRLGADRKLRVRAVSTTDPKQISERGGYYALFQGTFDVSSKKWLATDARPLKQDDYNGSDSALTDLDTQFSHTEFDTPERKAEWLDERMNEVYGFVRAILPPSRFAKIKQEQMDWLKKRDATTSLDEKCKLLDARIRSLQQLVW